MKSVIFTEVKLSRRQMMLKIMRDNIEEHEEKIDYIRKIFKIPEEEEDDLLESAEKQLIHGNFSWNAVLKITVVEARSLKASDESIAGKFQ